MKKRFTILIAALMLLTMISQPTRLWGQSTTYTSNVTLPTSGTNVYSCSVSISSNTYSAVRLGKSNTTGSGSITVPAGTVKLYVHCAGWSNETGNLTLSTSASGVTITPTTMSLTADSGISGSGSTFTLNATNASTSYFQEFTLSGVTTSTTITMTSPNKKRCVVWGVNYVIGHTLTYSATNGSISGVDAGSNAVASGASIAEGATVTLTATPASGYSFTSWEVSGTGSTLSSTNTSPTTFTMGTANATVTANFSAASGYINVSQTTATPTCAAQDVEFSIETDQTLGDNPTVFYTTSAGTSSTTAPDWIGDILYDEGELIVEVKQNKTSSPRTAYFRVESATVQSDVITITQSAFTLPAPSFSPVSGTTIITEDYVELGCDTTGVTIRYTMGANPDAPTTSTGTVYNPAVRIYVNANTTIKAIAVKYGISSSVATASYTVVTPLTTMDQIFSAATTAGSTATSKYVTLGNWVVSGVSTDEKTAYVTDGSGKGFITYYGSKPGFAVGNILSNTVQASLKLYNGAAEFTNLTASTTGIGITTGGTVTPITNKTIADLSGVCTGGVYKLSGLKYNNSSKYLSDGTDSIKPYNQLYSDMSFTNGETYNVTGVYLQYNSIKEILPRGSGDIVVAPGVTASPSSISDFTYNYGGGPSIKSFTISGANLTDDVTVTASSNYKVCKTSDGTYTSSVSYTPTTGTLASTTVYVRLESGLLSNTYSGKITVSSDGADDKEIALTGTVTHVIAYNTSLPTGCSVSSEPNGAQVAGESVSVSATAGSGYKFSAWDVYKTGESSTKVDVENDAFEMPAYNVTVSATFVEAYAVTYDANGGEGDMTDEDSPYISGSTVTVLTNTFTRDGYDFNHWDTKADDSGTDYNAGATFEIESAVTLYAQWSVKSYNVALSSIDNVDLSATWGTSGELAEGEDDDIDYGTEITLSASNMDAGKVFIWAITDDEDHDVTDDVLDGDVLTVPAYDITIGGQVAELFFQYSGELTEGDYIIARNSKAMNNTVTNNKFGTTNIYSYISGSEVIVANAADYTWHVAKIDDSDYWTIKNGSNFAASTGTRSQADLVSSFNSKCRWSISGTSTYTIVSRYNDSTSVNAYLRLNSSDYACYANSNSDSYFYKKASGSKHTVDIAASITYGNPSASPSKAYEGQTVALTPNPSSGYMLDSWDVYKTGAPSTKITVKNNSFVMPGYDVTVSATYRLAHTYTLVDGSTVTLEAGKHYIIASGVVSGKVKVMGAHSTDPTKNGYRTYDEVDVTSNQITETNGMYEVVFSGDGTNKWTMYDENYGLFICSTNSGGNITASSSISNNTKWTVSISSGAATITAQGGSAASFRYNSGSPRFTCYASGQQAVYLYKRDGDTDLEFHSNTSLASPTLSASNTITVESGAVLTLTGSPSCTNASWLVVEDGGQLISSKSVNATVKKEIAASTARDGEGWYTIASSVSSPDITDNTNLADGTYDLYRFNETEQSTPWENYKAHNSGVGADFTTLENGRGYLYRNGAKKTLTFAGALNVGTVDYAVTNSGGTLAGVNLVGNPYSHNITLGDNTSLLDKDNTALDAESQLTACYTLTNAGGWEPGQLDDDDPIKPTQGFLIEVPEDAAKIRFSEGSKKDRANNEYIKFIVENSNYSDVTYALFDKGLGLSKISHRNPAIPMIYIPQGKEDYAVAIMNDNTEAFGLNVKVATTGLYTLKYKTKGEFSYLHVIDRMTGEDIDMLLNGEYSFFSSIQDDFARFIVRLAYKPNYGNDNESVFAFQSGSEIFVSGEGELQVFDVLGRFVMSERINGVKAVSVPAQGVYVFRLVGENVKTQKIVIR